MRKSGAGENSGSKKAPADGAGEERQRRRDTGGEQGRRLRALRARHGLDQATLAESLGISRSTLADYETGTPIPESRLATLRERFPDDLLPGAPALSRVAAGATGGERAALPFAGNVPATTWASALEGADVLPVDPRLMGPDRFQARVVGSSCEPALLEGDVVVWRRELDPPPGALVLAQRKGDHGCTLKQLRFSDDGEPELWPVNPKYSRPTDGDGWGVIAVLVGVERRMGAATIIFERDGRPLHPSDLVLRAS